MAAFPLVPVRDIRGHVPVNLTSLVKPSNRAGPAIRYWVRAQVDPA